MFVDIHIHEKRNSPDSFISLEEIVVEAKNRGLDAICITDHDNYDIKEFAEEYSKKINFNIFVGCEYYSREGDILIFGMEKIPNELRLPAQNVVDYINSQGGICISAHPFRDNNRGLKENLEIVKGLAGVEVLNGSTSFEDNKRAYIYAKKLGLSMCGASDAHEIKAIGRFATWVPDTVKNTNDFVAAIKNKNCHPVVLSGYKTIDDMKYFDN